MAQNNKVQPFGMRDKIGYLFGDLANDMTFIFQSMFLMVFYTEVWGMNPAAVGTLFLVSRFVDAFTDVTMGQVLDKSKPARDGKFLPWIRRIAGPVAIASFLMYQTGLQDASMTTKMIYMYVTYLLWGSIFYTMINIPYGSMSSAITTDPNERTELSTFRSIGATLASLAIGTLTPVFIYHEVNGQSVVKTDATFTVVAGVFSVLAIIFYYLCYRMTTERVKIVSADTGTSPATIFKEISKVLSNRALVGIIFAALFLIMSQLMMGTMANYVFPNNFNNAGGISITNAVNPLLTLFIAAPLAPALSRRFGKKELGAAAMLMSSAAFAFLYFTKTTNMYVYIVFAGIGYLGFGIFNSIVWANITDVIDDVEVKTNNRQDGTVYSLYSFARKIGQAFAGAASGWLLAGIGYDSGLTQQTPEVLSGIYNVATGVPSVSFLLSGLSLIFLYPLTKSKVAENSTILSNRRKG